MKVVDGRPVNGKFWVFYGALSNVEYTITITDTQTGTVKTYFNPSGQLRQRRRHRSFLGIGILGCRLGKTSGRRGSPVAAHPHGSARAGATWFADDSRSSPALRASGGASCVATRPRPNISAVGGQGPVS
jgi:hypothetical protein